MANTYPRWWNQTVTVYNRRAVGNKTAWQRTVIGGCFWQNLNSRKYAGNAELDTNAVTCRIRKDERYIGRVEWLGLSDDERAGRFTISRGDVIILGDVDDEVDEYSQGKRSTDLINKYKEASRCMVVEDFQDDTGGGRGSEHYHVRGS